MIKIQKVAGISKYYRTKLLKSTYKKCSPLISIGPKMFFAKNYGEGFILKDDLLDTKESWQISYLSLESSLDVHFLHHNITQRKVYPDSEDDESFSNIQQYHIKLALFL